jgi:hypothetical protein
MLLSALISPPLHGELGAADELLVFCLPVVIAIVILAITSRRARLKSERSRPRGESRTGGPQHE